MPTGQAIINLALTTMGVLEQGGTPNTSDSTAALNELNDLWSSWSVDEGLIYAIIHERFPITATEAYYTMGPSALANFQAQIPGKIYQASFINALGGAISTSTIASGGLDYAVNDTGVVLDGSGVQATYVVNTVSGGAVATYTLTNPGSGFLPGNGYKTQIGGGQPGAGSGFILNITAVSTPGQNRSPLRIVNAQQFYSHRDLSAIALTPDELYPNFNPDANGFVKLYLWPLLSNGPAALELDMGVNFVAWTLATNYNLPPSLQDAIKWALAFRLLSSYGLSVQPQVTQVITAEAQKAELRFREMNKANRQIPAGQEMLGEPQAVAK